MDCLNFTSVKLKNYQLLPSKFIINPLNRGLLLLFDVGHGKTFTSIAMLRCLLTKYPTKKAIVLTPASLVSNYTQQLDFLSKDLDKVFSRIKVESYNKFINKIKKDNLKANSNTIIVCDEAQYLIGAGSQRFKNIFNYSEDAYKVILLSATPIRNHPNEISNLLSILNGYKVSRTLIEKIIDMNTEPRKKALQKLLSCKVALHRPLATGVKDNSLKEDHSHSSEFAKRINHRVPLVMSKSYYAKYYEIQENIMNSLPNAFDNTKNLTSFYNGIRRAVNIVSNTERSPKIDWVIYKIKKDLGLAPGYKGNKKILIYSNWLDAGVNLIKKELTMLNIKFSEVTGQLKSQQKDNEVKKYNSGETKVIILSSSGAEGLNLKNTRSVVLLEQAWNSSRLEQVVGRAIRLGSHKSLPLDQRKVDVYNLILEKPLSVKKQNNDFVPTADEMLEKLSRNKDILINKFYDIVKDISIEKNKQCFL